MLATLSYQLALVFAHADGLCSWAVLILYYESFVLFAVQFILASDMAQSCAIFWLFALNFDFLNLRK